MIAHTTQSMPKQDTTGTWAYMAPEQFIGKPRTASDQYALAVVVYEWLCGDLPFTGPDFDLYSYQHAKVAPPPLGKSVFPAVEAVVLQALEKDPKGRFEGVQDFAHALEQAYIEEITTCLDTPQRAFESLMQDYVQQVLLDHIVKDPNWWYTFAKPRMLTLQQHRVHPALTQALALFAKRAIPLAITTMEEDAPKEESAVGRYISACMMMVELLTCTASPVDVPEVWISFLHAILVSKKALDFIATCWDIHAQLLSIWNKILSPSPENNELIKPLLCLKWSEFGQFLSLQLHKEWKWSAIALLTSAPVRPTPDVVHNLEQKYPSQIEGLFQEFRHNIDIDSLLRCKVASLLPWSTAKSLFTVLVASGYTQKMRLLFILLDSPIGAESIREMLNVAHLTDEESAVFFERYGQQYPSSSEQFHIMMDIFTRLVTCGYPRKMELLFILLNSSAGKEKVLRVFRTALLTSEEVTKVLERYGQQFLQSYQQEPQLSTAIEQLFDMLVKNNHPEKKHFFFMLFDAQTSKEILDQLLTLAQLTIEESIAFFQRYGSNEKYLSFCYQSPAALKLFATLCQNGCYPEKWELLFVWFESLMSQGDLEEVLEVAHLTAGEKILFLKHFGKQYIPRYPQSSTLLAYIRHYLQEFDVLAYITHYSQELKVTSGHYLYRLLILRRLLPSSQSTSAPKFFQFLIGFSGQLPSEIQSYVQSWSEIIGFLVEPTTNKTKLTTLAAGLSHLPSATRSKLLPEVARAFVISVEDEIDLIVVMHSMSSVFTLDILQLFYNIAEKAGERDITILAMQSLPTSAISLLKYK